MKLLFLSDLHFNQRWYDWIRTQEVAAVFLAGDLLDLFRSGWPGGQKLTFADWVDKLPLALALCSGNHDHVSAESNWLQKIKRPGLVTDGETAILETAGGNLVVTTIPWEALNQRALWVEGARLREQFGLRWIVLHHEPPFETKIGGNAGTAYLNLFIAQFQPDLVASGHLHEQPYSGDFLDRLGSTWVFNPGHAEAPLPNCILVEDFQKATWFHWPNYKTAITSRSLL
ncbi:MAG: metallophosphoesterase [Verrucomicrobiia bacterium]